MAIVEVHDVPDSLADHFADMQGRDVHFITGPFLRQLERAEREVRLYREVVRAAQEIIDLSWSTDGTMTVIYSHHGERAHLQDALFALRRGDVPAEA